MREEPIRLGFGQGSTQHAIFHNRQGNTYSTALVSYLTALVLQSHQEASGASAGTLRWWEVENCLEDPFPYEPGPVMGQFGIGLRGPEMQKANSHSEAWLRQVAVSCAGVERGAHLIKHANSCLDPGV
jgi:hypothetical protein